LESEYRVGVQDSTDTAEARRTAMQLADCLGFDDAEAGSVGLVVTEAARNLLKHAGGGEVIIRAFDLAGTAGVEMLSLDKGPGIENVGRSFQDGYSTAGTPGTGLGAIARLAALHDIYTQPGHGTALLAQIRKRSRLAPPPAAPFESGAVSVPKKGEPVCGDAWGLQQSPSAARLVVADGLGHGLLAAEASRSAVRLSEELPALSGAQLMERIHGALRSTRGAAVAIAEVDAGRGVVQFTGIGNIAGVVLAPSGVVQRMVSHPGTAGHEVHRIVEFQYAWHPASVLVLHSDGVSSNWSLERYPGLAGRHPSLIAGVLYRDHRRERDDATVAVVRHSGNQN
jgi:anti-sigma regulatory factor (Ser/Thr protein kinase)